MKARKRFRKRVHRDFAVCIRMRVGQQVQRCVWIRNGRREIVTHTPMVCPAGHRVLWQPDGDWRCEIPACNYHDDPYEPEPLVRHHGPVSGDCCSGGDEGAVHASWCELALHNEGDELALGRHQA